MFSYPLLKTKMKKYNNQNTKALGKVYLSEYRANPKQNIYALLQAIYFDNTNPDIISSFLKYVRDLPLMTEEHYSSYYNSFEYTLSANQKNSLQFYPFKLNKLSNKDMFTNLIHEVLINQFDNINQDALIQKFNPPFNPYLFEITPNHLDYNYSYTHMYTEQTMIIDSIIELRPYYPLNIDNEDQFFYILLYFTLGYIISARKDTKEFKAINCFLYNGVSLLLSLYENSQNQEIKNSLLHFCIFGLSINNNCSKITMLLTELSKYNCKIYFPKDIQNSIEIANRKVPDAMQYYPYIPKIKSLLIKVIKEFLNSPLGKSLIKEMYKTEYDPDFDNYLYSIIQLHSFSYANCYGNTQRQLMITNIDITKRTITNLEETDPFSFVFHFSIWVITAIHEIIGHSYRGYLYYYSSFLKEKNTPKELSIKDDGGYYIEKKLFGSLNIKLTIPRIYYLFSNFSITYEEFEHYFSLINDEENFQISKDDFDKNTYVKEMKKLIYFEYYYDYYRERPPYLKLRYNTNFDIYYDFSERECISSKTFGVNKYGKYGYY